MQWTRDTSYQPTEMQSSDVYSDVKTSYSASHFNSTEAQQEFSLSSIQERLGQLSPAEDADVTVATADVMPSSQTLNMSYSRNYSEQTKTASRLSTKTKVMIASYAIVVLALIIGVTLCSVSVSGSFLSATALNAEYTEAATKVAELTEQINADDYAVLAEKAAELGYIDASKSNTQTYTEIETRPAQNFNVQTNWFDSLCDWLSGVFGG